jgi:thiol-disulfide isomerase/thioredoxin
VIAVFVFISCKQRDSLSTTVNFRIHSAYGYKVYLKKVPFRGEKEEIIDSATVKSGNDIITFRIRGGEQSAFRLKVKDTRLDIILINDSPEIEITANILRPADFTIKGSPASASVISFLKMQEDIIQGIRANYSRVDSLKQIKSDKTGIDSIRKKSDKDLQAFFQHYKNYTDTVSSPAAFLYVYNYVDFGKDHEGLKQFILRAAKRFPGYQRIQVLKERTIEYLTIFEEEFEIGEYLPAITLQDQSGREFSTDSLKGRWIFIDFWSTWCDACLQYDAEKLAAKKAFPSNKFEIVSVALDAEKETWKQYVADKKYDWPQLIDEKMWEGNTVKALKIDSIPFNFLLDPVGKIVEKAIKPDSLVKTIREKIKDSY